MQTFFVFLKYHDIVKHWFFIYACYSTLSLAMSKNVNLPLIASFHPQTSGALFQVSFPLNV